MAFSVKLRPVAALAGILITCGGATPLPAADYWLDLYTGEEVTDATLGEDLATADVIYVGEIHTVARHHEVQTNLLEKLAAAGRPLTLGLEQIEARHQPAVERFNSGELDFGGLAREISWEKQWKNFEQYRPLCEAAQKLKIPLRALNAPADIIRAIGRGGLTALSSEQRKQLPDELVTDDAPYEKLMNLMLSVHMTMDPQKLRPIFEAQVTRDETMAAQIAAAMKGEGDVPRTVMVVCGRGHISYGLGLPDRVARRVPSSTPRIVLVTESGELKLTPQEEAMRRDITISHTELRSLGRPLADYLRVLPRSAPAKAAKETAQP